MVLIVIPRDELITDPEDLTDKEIDYVLHIIEKQRNKLLSADDQLFETQRKLSAKRTTQGA
jgi:hypothetical protein